jgi:hypothetical protein
MDIIPLIHIKNRKILINNKDIINPADIDIFEKHLKNKYLYIIDNDGILKYKPNLCLFQNLSKSYILWVDIGPRVIGDIVDAIMAGATNIIVRKNLWKNKEISIINELTDNMVYLNISLENYNEFSNEFFSFDDNNGFVVYNRKYEIESDFKFSSFLKNLCLKYKLFAYEDDIKNISYWDNLGFSGLLVDITNIKEFVKNGF